jgi:hypothetical protein
MFLGVEELEVDQEHRQNEDDERDVDQRMHVTGGRGGSFCCS